MFDGMIKKKKRSLSGGSAALWEYQVIFRSGSIGMDIRAFR